MRLFIILVLISVFIINSANGHYNNNYNIELDSEYGKNKAPPPIDLEYLRGPIGDPGYLNF
jgi:hypothetical protein